jgi:chorismate mutase
MATLIVKELIVRGKVAKELSATAPVTEVSDEYYQKLKKEIIEACKEQIKEELEREKMK